MTKLKKLFSSELFWIGSGLVLFLSALTVEYLTRHLSFSVAAMLLYILALVVSGWRVFLDALRGIIRRDLLDEKFLMSIASIGAMIIGDMTEGVAVMLFFLVGEYFEHRAVASSRRSIRSLMSIRPDEATVVTAEGEEVMDAEDVPVGSEIVIRAGERVPIDATVISGGADLDTSALTGEAVPRPVGKGSSVESGSVVIGGVLNCRTVRLAEESAAARILNLVENATERKSKEENFITVFSRYYTPAVVVLAILMAVLPPLLGDSLNFRESVYRALSFLVISCPCALVISVPMAFFGGIGCAASRGILFKGGNTFSALSRADSFVFDKTGTLTTGSFAVTRYEPVNISGEELLFYAASAEYGSTHPIAECIKKLVSDVVKPEEYREIAGKGVISKVNGIQVLVGTEALLMEEGIVPPVLNSEGLSVVCVALDGAYVGRILISDEIKSEAKSALSELNALGVGRTVMLSGDRLVRARKVADELSISEVEAELLPEDKFSRLEEVISTSRGTVFVGDGINDAPSLARADVGVAMGAIGTDSAIEAADVVIMSDSLDRLPTAVRISRKTMRIAKENIIFAIGVKLAVLILSAFGIANMWLAVFADVGVAVIAILNAMRTLRVR